ncbi:uncharacterized protein ARMOST_19814 [Armillaria ostoyae]|uniref:Integrase catalytic domain-containing protein n=1 Tax=Armillaria ostoyae TaxID=47428 RepID=A0A284S5K5_ARMOS|nr:uncharacterized protein ARMOST_19814 [Armillaria ostoyae]
MITGLPDSNGHDALLVVVDRFSKAIILVPCNVELSAERWARILQDHVYARHGMPQVVISDRGPQFVSKFMTELYKLLDIKQNASTAFHPQTDGQTEHVNQEVEKYLRIFINHQQTDWTDWLPLAEFEQPPPPPPDLIDEEEQWEIKEVLNSKTRKVRGSQGQPSTTVNDYFIKWKGWTQEHNSWVAEKDMGNAKEAIADYIKKTKHNERVAIVKITTTPRSPLAMIVNHHYSDDGDWRYLAQREDGTQKWLLNPSVDKYRTFLEEYWANYHSTQDLEAMEP